VTSLAVHGLSVARGERTLVEGLDLRLPGGSVCALLGPSGCGKSSLLAVLAGQLRPRSGTVAVTCGSVISDPAQRPVTALLPQELALAGPSSLLANAANGRLRSRPFLRFPWGPGRADRAEAMDLLRRLGIGHLVHREALRVSGGERQRCALARTMLTGAPVWLLDEPVSQLDPDTARVAMDLVRVRAVASDAVVVAALHQPALANACDHQLELDGAGGWRLSEAA
jgi:ABC-type cobalamin/Fe3+-siderophores transport system ATPase subunit